MGYFFNRVVDILCVIIYGIVKSVIYEVGEINIDGLINLWNVVFVGGLWWFIFLFWVCWSVVGYSIGKWILIELKGSYCIKFDVLKSLFDFLLNKFVCKI